MSERDGTPQQTVCVEATASDDVSPVDGSEGGQAAERPARALTPTNVDVVRRMRARKFAGLRWRYPPVGNPASGDPLNFLPAETAKAFGIPDELPVSAHQYEDDVLALVEGHRSARFLDVGAGLRHVYHRNVVNLDIFETASTDVLSVGEDLPFADDQFDYILCFAVLEHTMRPWDVAREMCRVLKPGGTLIIDWPFLQPVHGYPHHFYAATPTGNASMFQPYCEVTGVEILRQHHPATTTRWVLTAWRDGLPPEVAARFEALPIGDMIRMPLEDQLEQDWAKSLHPMLMRAIPAGSRVTAVRRPGPLPVLDREQFRLEQARLRLEGERDRVESERGRLEEERDRLQQDRDRLDRERQRLERENGWLRHEAGAAQASLDILRSSTSWRVTGPLRAAARLFARRP